MNDRELLELAAKAVGYDTSHHWNKERLGLTPPVDSLCIPGVRTAWNPLKNDEDAFRLAVALKMDLMQYDCDEDLKHTEPYACADYLFDEPYETNGGDACAATRRAIVRAAAHIELERLEKYRA